MECMTGRRGRVWWAGGSSARKRSFSLLLVLVSDVPPSVRQDGSALYIFRDVAFAPDPLVASFILSFFLALFLYVFLYRFLACVLAFFPWTALSFALSSRLPKERCNGRGIIIST